MSIAALALHLMSNEILSGTLEQTFECAAQLVNQALEARLEDPDGVSPR
ncbi:hypothetical protein [Nitrosospira sp. Is2]|nr:hypothetical protein [Nitrosospira sp. Is2]WON74414.1 hypothetical protein R5L00_02680 [Nitrosospira sp. Is2]